MDVSFDHFHNLESVELYLCNPDERPLFSIDAVNRNVILRFNDLSELTFDYYDKATSYDGNNVELGGYDMLQTRRLVYATKIGWFVITNVVEHDDGVIPYKSVTCSSLQTRFNDKNVASEERIYYFYNPSDPMDDNYNPDDPASMPSVAGQLFKQLGIAQNLSQGRTTPQNPYPDWTITYINSSLKNCARTLDDNVHTAYEWMIGTVGDAYEACFLFDFMYKTIQVVLPAELNQKADVLFSFSNFMQNVEISEESENLVTVLDVNGGNCNITNVNPTGTNYICNFDYYMDSVEHNWMSDALITALTAWKADVASSKATYKSYVQDLRKWNVQLTESNDNLQYYSVKLTDLKNARDKKIVADASGTTIDPDTSTLYGIITAESVEENNLWDEKWEKGGILLGKDTDDQTKCRSIGYINVTPNETLKFSIASGSSVVCHLYTSTKAYLTFLSPTAGELTIPANVYFMRLVYNNSYYRYDVCITRPSDNMGGDKSLLSSSPYYSTNFTRYTSSIDAYSSAPTFDATNKTWSFSGTPVSGTATEHIQAQRYYFMDVTTGDYANKSYCKLQPKEVVNNNTTYTFCQGFERFAAYDELPFWIDKFEEFVNTRNSNIAYINTQINIATAMLESLSSTLNIINYIGSRTGGADLLKELYCYWIEGGYTNDNISVEDGTPFEKELDLEEELLQAGETELVRVSQPKLSFSLSAVDYLSQYEFRDQAKALELGKIITVERKEGIWYYPMLLEISMSLDNHDSFTLKFANALKLTDWNFTYAELLFDASTVTRQVGANWQNLMQYTNDRQEIGSLVRDPLSATLRASFANMKNQNFTTDDTGILGRKELSEGSGTYDNKQVRLLNNVLLFTDDNWQTVKTALGEITDGQNTTYGLVAETIIGSLILGNTLNITNGASSVTLNQNGITIMNNSTTPPSVVFSADTNGNVVVSGGWVTEEELENALETKNTTFTWNGDPNTEPTGMITGDLLIRTDEGNKLYRYNGNIWMPVSDARIANSTDDVQIVYYLVDTYSSVEAGEIPDPPEDNDHHPYWVDTSTPGSNYWTKSLPTPKQHNPSGTPPHYAIYYSCTQTRSMGGIVANSAVVKQDGSNTILEWCATEGSNTTVINGGMIATNSIFADKLETNSIITQFLTVKESATSSYVVFGANPSGTTTGGIPPYSVKIAGFMANSYVMFSGTNLGNANTFIASSPVDWSTKEVAGQYRSDWLLKVGSYFGVTNNGSLYCTNGTFSGDIVSSTISTTQINAPIINATNINGDTVFLINSNYTDTRYPENRINIGGFTVDKSHQGGRTNYKCLYTNHHWGINDQDYSGVYLGEDGISIYGDQGNSYMRLDVVNNNFFFKGTLVATDGTFSGILDAAKGTFGTGDDYKWNIGGAMYDSTTGRYATSSIYLNGDSGQGAWFPGCGNMGPSASSAVHLSGEGFSLFYPAYQTDYCTSIRPGAFLTQALLSGNVYNGVYGGIVVAYDRLTFYANQPTPLYSSLNSNYVALNMKIDINNTIPSGKVTLDSGELDARGHIIVASADVIGSSDSRAKNTISDIDNKYEVMFDALKPSTFKYNDGTSGRLHTGYIAQDVYNAIEVSGLTTQEFAGYVDFQLEGKELGLRYEEFVSLNTWQIQKLKHRVATLEARIAELETAVNGDVATQNIDTPETQEESQNGSEEPQETE